MVHLSLATTRKYLAFPWNQHWRSGYVGDWSFASSEEHSWVKIMQFPQLWRNLWAMEGLWGQRSSPQHMSMQKVSKGLQVNSTALSWSCSLWDDQAARRVAKLVPCHPQGERSWNDLICLYIPTNLGPTPQPDSPSTMSSCSPLAVSPVPAAPNRFMWNSTFPQSKCATSSFLSNFSLPRIIWSTLYSVSAKIWGNWISHNSYIKAVNIQRNPPSTPTFPSPDSRVFGLLSWCYIYLTFIG